MAISLDVKGPIQRMSFQGCTFATEALGSLGYRGPGGDGGFNEKEVLQAANCTCAAVFGRKVAARECV